jgi:hypothetical protein
LEIKELFARKKLFFFKRYKMDFSKNSKLKSLKGPTIKIETFEVETSYIGKK